jgi:hypothetical protein
VAGVVVLAVGAAHAAAVDVVERGLVKIFYDE